MSTGFHSKWRQGSAAERGAFSTTGIAIPFWWYETDTGYVWWWDSSAWKRIGSLPISAADVEVEEIGAATYDDVQDWINNTQSAGRISGGAMTANIAADGTLDIAAGTGFIKVTDSDIGVSKFFDWDAASALALADGECNYIYVDYNTGTEAITIAATTTRTDIDGTTEFILGRVHRSGNDLHIINSGTNLYNHVYWNHQRLVDVRGFERATGGVIAESGQRYLTATAGLFYLGANPQTTDAQDTSGAERFSHWYNDGAWQETTGQQQLGNTQYNDYGTGLAALTAADPYGVYWVFIHFDSDIQVVYGIDKYKLAEAEAAVLPPNLPDAVSCFATLAAKIIFERNQANVTSVVSAYETIFPVSSPANHNDLGGIQGGAADEYYHFTAAQHTVLTGTTDGAALVGTGAALELTTTPEWEGIHTFPNTGLHILDANAAFDLIIKPAGGYLADRTLEIVMSDASRQITFSGNPTLADWFDQAVKAASSPTFADVFVPDGGEVGISANERFVFDAAGYVRLTGASLAIAGAAAPAYKFVIDCVDATNGFQIVGDDTGRLATDGFTFALVSTTVYINNRENASMFFWTNNTSAVEINNAQEVLIADLGGGGNQDVGADNVGKLYVPFVSDRKFKDNVEPLTGALDTVLSMRAVEFDWNKGALTKVGLDFGDSPRQVGMIAQEVKAAAPLAGRSGKWESYNQRAVLGYVVEAIKELNAKVEAL